MLSSLEYCPHQCFLHCTLCILPSHYLIGLSKDLIIRREKQRNKNRLWEASHWGESHSIGLAKKVHLGFSVRCHRKTQKSFLANPIDLTLWSFLGSTIEPAPSLMGQSFPPLIHSFIWQISTECQLCARQSDYCSSLISWNTGSLSFVMSFHDWHANSKSELDFKFKLKLSHGIFLFYHLNISCHYN